MKAESPARACRARPGSGVEAGTLSPELPGHVRPEHASCEVEAPEDRRPG